MNFQLGKRLSSIVGLLLMGSVLLLGFAGSDAHALFGQSEDPGGSGTGACHCGEALCGCKAPYAGCALTASCSCPSSGECTQTCTYHCA